MAVNDSFNWLYLLVLLICGFLSVLFLFYFNRVFASLVSYAIRTYAWRQYRVYVDIQALQFSLLGGRCFFKGFRYHGHNETVLVNDGYITWRYWLRRVRDAECLNVPSSGAYREEDEERQNSNTQSVKARSASNLPCRIKLKIRGVEWFIYNRTPAYEAIGKHLSGNGHSSNPEVKPAQRHAKITKRASKLAENGTNAGHSKRKIFPSEADEKWTENESVGKSFSNSSKSVVKEDDQQMPRNSETFPAFLALLPVKVECSKGAIVMGNHSTRSALTAKFDAVNGHIDARRARSIDLYKQIFEFDFLHPVIELKVNHDFNEPKFPTAAKTVPDGIQPQSNATQRRSGENKRKTPAAISAAPSGFVRVWKKALRSVFHRAPRGKKHMSTGGSQVPGLDNWLGLTRYLDDEENIAVEQERWKTTEYGQHPVMVDSPSITMSLHWDVPGLVPDSTEKQGTYEDKEDINGSMPPEWAVELRINGGLISYGPWADRLRNDLQPMFFPNSYKDALPTKRLAPGQPRVSTTFKLNVDIEQTTTFMIPTRETSKDWRWKDDRSTKENTLKEEKAQKGHGKKRRQAKVTTLSPGRPYGWLDLELQPDSTITFTMDLVARRNGYRNLLDLDIRGPTMSTSVNHGLLMRLKRPLFPAICHILCPGTNSAHGR